MHINQRTSSHSLSSPRTHSLVWNSWNFDPAREWGKTFKENWSLESEIKRCADSGPVGPPGHIWCPFPTCLCVARERTLTGVSLILRMAGVEVWLTVRHRQEMRGCKERKIYGRFPLSLALNDFFGSSCSSSMVAAPRLAVLPGPWAPGPVSPPFPSPARGHAC